MMHVVTRPLKLPGAGSSRFETHAGRSDAVMGRQAGPARCRDDVFEGVPAFVRVLGARQTCPQW